MFGEKSRQIKELSEALKNSAVRVGELEISLRAESRQNEHAAEELRNAREEIAGLKDQIASRDAELKRLRALLDKADKGIKSATKEKETETVRADTADTNRINAEAALARARRGEDPETDTFYRRGVGRVSAAPAKPATDAGAEPSAEEVTPAEAPKGKKAKPPRR